MRGMQILASATGVAAILILAYTYAGALAFSGILSAATWFELFIFGLQLAKAATVLSLKVLRDAPPAVLIDIFGIDLVLLPILILAYLLLGTASIAALAAQLIRAWMTGAGLALLAYSAYWVPRSMLRSARLRTVLPSTMAISGVGITLANSAGSAASQGGLGGVVTGAIATSGNFFGAGLGTYAALGMIYVSLLLYALVGWSPEPTVRTNYGLIVAILATAGTAGWVISFESLTSYVALILLPPTFLVVALSWWFGHAA